MSGSATRSANVLALGGLMAAAATVAFVVYDWPGARHERAIAAFLVGKVKNSDVVVVTPAGSLDRLRVYAGAGLHAISENSDATIGGSGFSRAWMVGALGAKTPPPVATGGRVSERHDILGTAVWLVTRADERASTRDELTALLRDATVTARPRAPQASERPCPRDGERFRCGQESWQWIGPAEITVGGEVRSCIWAHPIAADVLSIELPALARLRRFRVTTLLSDGAATRETGSPIDVRIVARDAILTPPAPPPARGTIRQQVANPPNMTTPSSGINSSNTAITTIEAKANMPPRALLGAVAQGGGERLLARITHGLRESRARRDITVPPDVASIRVLVSAAQDGAAHFCFDVRELQ